MISQLDRQRKRINHIINTTGIQPEVLDVSEEHFDELVKELEGTVRYTAKTAPSDSFLGYPSSLKQLELFGTRFIKELK
jgi:hypothetical protein